MAFYQIPQRDIYPIKLFSWQCNFLADLEEMEIKDACSIIYITL